MLPTLAALTLSVLATAGHTDTTFSVRPGARLEINDFSGSIEVQAWARNEVRVEADHSHHAIIRIHEDTPTVSIQVSHLRGIPSSVDYRLSVPKWMSLELGGVNTDVSVDGSQAEIKIQSVQGDISITGGAKLVEASSVEGEVRVTGASGKVECSSVNSDVHLEKVSGEVVASSVNGEVTLRDIESDDVEASTVSGEINYDGTIRDGGSYRFSSHNGNVSVAISDRANATISVATYGGAFSSAFPVKLTETHRGKRFTFALGNGSARLELESFQGEIELRRPGTAPGTKTYEYRYEYSREKETLQEKEKTKTKTKTKEKDKKSDDPDEDNEP